ncbi:P-loop containing nucleoside triphosphate hydrolase protein [Hypoxylon sp. FL1150]|nr:P-loop containing nucleoside triphosphate hydrolase protein [Hypoxylon sp. FL1150]
MSILHSEFPSKSSFVRVPPSCKSILDERLVKLPFQFTPSEFERRLRREAGRYFQPRDRELNLIQAALFPFPQDQDDPETPTHRALSVTGLGGVGKTELVYEYMARFRDHFDAIFFITADSESQVCREYSMILVELGLVDAIDRKDLKLYSRALKSWLSDPVITIPKSQEARTTLQWLLVFDNVRDPDMLENYWPAGHNGKILITTRNPLCSYGAQITDKLQLKGLATPDAVQLLRFCAGDERQGDGGQEEDATTIAEWVEGFPLALEQLGNIIYSEYITISQFRETYPTKSDLFKRLYAGYNGKSLITTWGLEDIRERNQEAFLVLGLISLLDPGLIKIRLIPRLHPSDTVSSTAMSSQYISIQKELADASLIEINRGTGSIKTYRLVQEVTKDLIVRMGLAASIFQVATNRVVGQWPFLDMNYGASKIDRWNACQGVYSHILHLKKVYEEFVRLGVPCLVGTDLAELLLEAAQLRLESRFGPGQEVASLLDTAELIYRDCPDVEARARFYRARIGLAASFKDGHHLLYYAQLVFDIEQKRHQISTSPSPTLAIAYNNLAIGLAYQRDWNGAIGMLNESVRIREGLYNFTRDILFSPLYHLGLVYQYQQRYDEAEEILNEAMQDLVDAFGSVAADSLQGVGLLYARGIGRFERAGGDFSDTVKSLVNFKEATARATRIAGARHRITLVCQYQYARVAMSLLDYDRA